jgi:hypothetical protein
MPDGLAEALGDTPDATYDTGALDDVLTIFRDEAAIRALAPDFSALAPFTPHNGKPIRVAARLQSLPPQCFGAPYFQSFRGHPSAESRALQHIC